MSKILPIVLHPHPVLRQVAAPVERVDESIREILDDMVATMRASHGVALAANQVNVLKRLVTVDFDYLHKIMNHYGEDVGDMPRGMGKLVNPAIRDASREMYVHRGEGCLSVPDVYTEIERPERITLDYLDENGVARTAKLQYLGAACLHHEVDHLNGVLFMERMGKLKRSMIEKKYGKLIDYFREHPRYRVLLDTGVVEADPSAWKE